MNKILYFIICLTGLCACTGGDRFVLQGELTDYPYDEIWVVYDDPVSKLDTIYPKKGKFTYEIIPDTTTLFRLLTPGMQSVPMVAEKGDKVSMEGTFSAPVIRTKGANHVYADFLENVKGAKPEVARTKAEEVIRQHPQSFVSAYLIEQYFVQQEHPDAQKIKELMAPLDGKVKDCRVLTLAYKQLQNEKNTPQGTEYLGYFSYKDRNGKYANWNLTEGSYALVNIWASWDEASRQATDSIRKIALKLPEEKFKVIDISIDSDKKAWLAACRDDGKRWIEVCDFKGWNTAAVQQNKVQCLPANFLIDRNRKIIDKNIFGDALYEKVKQLIKEKP